MIPFEKLVSRSVVIALSRELDISGTKISVNRLLEYMIVGGLAILIILAYGLFLFKVNVGLAALAGIIGAVVYEIMIYAILEFRVEQRKNFVESILPDFLQISAANIRSGAAMDKAIVMAARPEFKYFSDDVKDIDKMVYAGETLQNALTALGNRYRSLQLRHTIRMMNEAIQYGGGMTDLLNQVAKDLRAQNMMQKEVSGQLFLYTIFIAFAALIGAPVLYGLTTQMITVTDNVWAGILKQNPGGLPTAGVSFLRPSPPKITIAQYHTFALTAIIIITGFGAFIISAIANGSVLKGIKYLPIFLIAGIGIYLLVVTFISGLFTTISGV
ncbi:MAG: type II secretion system F family protein [Candidatus Micrarchaeia archaeon]